MYFEQNFSISVTNLSKCPVHFEQNFIKSSNILSKSLLHTHAFTLWFNEFENGFLRYITEALWKVLKYMSNRYLNTNQIYRFNMKTFMLYSHVCTRDLRVCLLEKLIEWLFLIYMNYVPIVLKGKYFLLTLPFFHIK